jgi:hypothetical protein
VHNVVALLLIGHILNGIVAVVIVTISLIRQTKSLGRLPITIKDVLIGLGLMLLWFLSGMLFLDLWYYN